MYSSASRFEVGMDNAQGSETAAGTGAADAGGDWRSQLTPGGRSRVVNMIVQTLNKHMPVTAPESRNAFEKIAERFEKKTYAAATNKADYLRKLSLKILSMESWNKINAQQSPQNDQVFHNQRPCNLVDVLVSEQTRGWNLTSRDSNEQSTRGSAMDNVQGSYPATGAGAADDGGNWRSHLMPGARSRIVDKIMATLNKHLPVTVPEGQIELKNIAVRFEERIYAAATNQADYLRKISLKMLSMERQEKTNTQPNPRNGQVVQNQRPCNLTSSGSTSRTGYTGASDMKKELGQMNTTLKDQYQAGLSDLHEISTKLRGEIHVPTQEPKNVHEEVKFKVILERAVHSIQINKKISLEEGVPIYKRQITSILNSEERMPRKNFQQSEGQAPSTSSTPAHGVHLPERSNVKRLKPSPEDDIPS